MEDAPIREVLDAERAAALARVRAMTAEIEEIAAASADTNADDEHDPEGSTLAYERAQVAALLGGARTYLDDLDRALARLDEGRYTVCEQCGARIDPERLTARPATRSCIRCAASQRRL